MNIKEVFKREKLIIPDYDKPNFVDLVNALYSKFGKNFKNNKNIDMIRKMIPDQKHTLFILLDGAGSNLIEHLNENSILRSHKKMDLITVSPCTTGCVLTSLATAKYPSEHGIIGWYSYNRKFNRDYYPLLFQDRKTNKSLLEYNIKPNDIYKEKSVLNSLKIETKALFPDYIYDSIYSQFVINDENRISYKNIENAFAIIDKRIKNLDQSFTYLYIPYIDSLSHAHGVYSSEVKKTLCEIEKSTITRK